MKLTHLLTAITMVFFIGCGGGEEQQQAASGQQGMAEDVRTIELIGIDQMKFGVGQKTEGTTVSDTIGADNDLLRLETITAEPGEKIRIVLTTRSSLPAQAMAHNWVLLAMGTNAQEFATAAAQAKDNDYIPQNRLDAVIAQTGMAAGGETTEVTFTVPEQAGEYDYICSFPGHFVAGMRGKLVVQEPQSTQM